jgi:hypothetical protein
MKEILIQNATCMNGSCTPDGVGHVNSIAKEDWVLEKLEGLAAPIHIIQGAAGPAQEWLYKKSMTNRPCIIRKMAADTNLE